MPKRKVPDSEENEYEEEPESQKDESEAEETDASGKQLKSKKEQKTKTPATKKVKSKGTGSSSEVATADTTSSKILVKTSADGGKYFDLGKKKRASVRSFNGAALLDIREFYESAGEEKPGKKGISLNFEQWQVLKEGMATIDQLFADLKAKK
ncbi:PC4-domain-containing protein [Agrocybe pediades]|nr:PC4-domain-containing protein [Agrocybe pediades]